MDTSTLKFKLENAATTYDRKQSTKKGYNHYALAQYLMRVDEVIELVNSGMPIRSALVDCFNDRLLDHLLVNVNEPKHDPRS